MRIARRTGLMLLALGAHVAPLLLHAQAPVGDAGASPWAWRWSPLRSMADLGLPAPRSAESPRLFELPAPRIGLAWTAGNPAGLYDDVDSSYTRLAATAGGVQGAYRRPLEGDRGSASALSMAAWRRVGRGGRVAAIGRVGVEREAWERGLRSAFVNPYGGSPFVPADTNRPALRRPVVTIEGGEAIAFGRWRIGAAVGFRLLENNSANSAAAVLGRASTAGLTLGGARRVGERGAIGVQLRRRQGSESVNIVANPRAARVYPLDGLVSVEPRDVFSGLPPYFRRADRGETSLGVDGAASRWGAHWSGFARWQATEERLVSVISSSAPVDRWRTSGYTLGGAAQRPLWGTLATVRATWESQLGDAERATVKGGSYAADASSLELVADVRSKSPRSAWLWGAVASLRRDWQAIDDHAARMTTDIAAWSPALAAEVGRVINARLSLLAGYAASGYTPYAGIPSPLDRGRAYTTLIAPAMEVAAAGARSGRLSAGGRLRIGGRAVTGNVWYETLQPLERPTTFEIPLPKGTRRMWGVVMGVGSGGGAER